MSSMTVDPSNELLIVDLSPKSVARVRFSCELLAGGSVTTLHPDTTRVYRDVGTGPLSEAKIRTRLRSGFI